MSPQPTWSAPRGQPLFSGVTLLKESMRFYTDMFASLPFLTFYFEIISSLQKNCESPKDRFLPTHWRVTRPDPCTLTIHKAIHDGVTCESKAPGDRARPASGPARRAGFALGLSLSPRLTARGVTVRNPGPITPASPHTGRPRPAGADPLRWTPPRGGAGAAHASPPHGPARSGSALWLLEEIIQEGRKG